jgi:hypothetical protein
MAGVSLSDFGDLVRSCGASAAEDEKDLSKVFLDVAKFKAIVKGYLSSAGSFLTPVERRHLVHGAKWMTLMVGARFLTDYLDGDRYFKTRRPGHNLDRCRTQFKLLRSIEEREDELERIVEGVSRVS